MKTINIISRGVASCTKNPSLCGNCEGFNPNEKYMFERCEADSMKYVRLYGTPMKLEETEPLNFSPPFKYETTGIGTFKMCFKIISEQAI